MIELFAGALIMLIGILVGSAVTTAAGVRKQDEPK